MNRIVFLSLGSLLIAFAGCGGAPMHDLSTPESAILSLEDAYRAADMEAALKCKDFDVEAKLMLEKVNTELSDDPELLQQTAEVLKLGFMAEMKEKGFPDFRGITSTFSNQKPYQGRDDIVEITETCNHGNGQTTTNQLTVAKTAAGWKMVMIPD